MMRDLESSRLDEKDKALLRFVAKVNHDSPRITPADMQPLYAGGLGRRSDLLRDHRMRVVQFLQSLDRCDGSSRAL